MAVIGFGDDSVWHVAGWCLRQLFVDVELCYNVDEKMAWKFDQARALSGLHLDLIDSSFSARILTALSVTVAAILDDSIVEKRSAPLDDETQAMYKAAVQELATYVNENLAL